MSFGASAASILKQYVSRFVSPGYGACGGSVYPQSLSDPFSLSLRVKTTTASIQALMLRTAVTLEGWATSIRANGAIRLRLTFLSSTQECIVETSSTGWNDGKWHAILITHDGTRLASGIKIYVDGVSQTLTTIANTLVSNATPSALTYIGQDVASGGTVQLSGDIADVAVFNAALSAGNATTLYNGGNPCKIATYTGFASLQYLWQMGDAAIYPTIPNRGTGTHDCTLTGFSGSPFKLKAPPFHT